MTDSYRIRTALQSDATQMTGLSLELGYPVSVTELGQRLQALLASTRDVALVAEGPALQLLGWIAAGERLVLESASRTEITGLVVGAAARRSGVGRALVAAVEAWAVQQGSPLITVRSNILRAESHPFYRSLGFRLKKTQHYYEKSLRGASGA